MSAKNKWLIKSDSKILGPYSFEQVEDLILKKQISLIDEIRDMETRWSYVREVPEFKSFVESVRTSGDQKSDITQTIQTALQKTNTKSNFTQTEPAMNFSQVDLPVELSPTDVEVVATVSESSTEPIAAKKNRVAYVSPADAPAVERRSHILKLALIFFIIIGFVGTIWYYLGHSGQSQEERTLAQQIRKYNLYAMDEKAIETFKKLPLSSHEKVLVDIIPLWSKLESAGAVQSEEILDIATTDKLEGNERKSQYQLYKFVKAYLLGDIQSAKDALVQAIDMDPSAQDVKENNAAFLFLEKKYSEAAQVFKSLYDQTNYGRFLYGYILSQIYGNSVDAPVISQLVEKHLDKHVDFAKELLFLQLYVLKKYFPENTEVYNQYYRKFLDFPLHLSNFFKVSSLVVTDLYRWEYLKNIRNDLTLGKNDKPLFIMNLHYLIENGEMATAYNFYQKNLQVFTPEEKVNWDVTFSYLGQDPNKKIPEVSPEFLGWAERLYLLSMLSSVNGTGKASESEIQLAQTLSQEKSLFANWSQLMLLKWPQDKEQIRALINKDTMYNNDFKPYLRLKAVMNE